MSTATTIRAPDLDMPGIAWLNVPRPLTLSELRGRLVILDFWSFCCINCLHSLETLRRLEDAFPRELVVIGVHSPKFTAERDLENVRQAVLRHRISHPIAHDPDRRLWERYAVGAWPTLVIVSPDGDIVSETRGEPDAEQLRSLVQQLLDEERTRGRLQPTPLELRAESSGGGRFRFPAKVKPMPGVRQRWAIADAGNHQIVLLEDDGTEIQRFGDGQPGFKDGPGLAARFDTPQGLVCSAHAIFVADTGNHAIRHIDIGERVVTTLAGTGRRGQRSARRGRRGRSRSRRPGTSSSTAHSSSSPTPARTSSRRSTSSVDDSVCSPAADARRSSTARPTRHPSRSPAVSCSTTAVRCSISSTARARLCVR
jgi:thiol-disulfide isomerase/thioredoxin